MVKVIGTLIQSIITLIGVLVDIVNAVGTWLDAIIPG
jgi:hypothetical protein